MLNSEFATYRCRKASVVVRCNVVYGMVFAILATLATRVSAEGNSDTIRFGTSEEALVLRLLEDCHTAHFKNRRYQTERETELANRWSKTLEEARELVQTGRHEDARLLVLTLGDAFPEPKHPTDPDAIAIAAIQSLSHLATGHYDNAIELIGLLAPYHPSVAASHQHLLGRLCLLNGEEIDALKALLKAHHIAATHLNNDALQVDLMAQDLAMAYLRIGKLKEASQQLSARTNVLKGGLRTPPILDARYNYLTGLIAQRKGRFVESQKDFQNALQLYDREPFSDPIGYIECLLSACDSSLERLDFDDSREMLRLAEELAAEHLIAAHPLHASILRQRAAFETLLGNPNEGLELSVQAFDLHSEHYGTHPECALDGQVTARILLRTGHYEDAKELLTVSAAYFNSTRRKYDLCITLNLLGNLAFEKGELLDASGFYDSAAKMVEDEVDPRDPIAKMITYHRAKCAYHSRSFDESLTLLESVLRPTDPLDSPLNARIALLKATALGEIDKSDAAIRHVEVLQEKLIQIPESSRPALEIECFIALTILFLKAENIDAAENAVERAMELSSQKYGRRHPVYVQALYWKAQCELARGHQDSAKRHMDEANTIATTNPGFPPWILNRIRQAITLLEENVE